MYMRADTRMLVIQIFLIIEVYAYSLVRIEDYLKIYQLYWHYSIS